MLIELPWPDAKLNPNRSKGAHWGSTVTLRKKARDDAMWVTKGAMAQKLTRAQVWRPGEPECAVVITFVQPDKRRRDRDNLLSALKPALDGIADALGINDSQFEPMTLRREYGSKPGCVRVEIL